MQINELNHRPQWLRLFAMCEERELENMVAEFDLAADAKLISGPQTGIVTVRGRISGHGQRFNVGDACVTRAKVLYKNNTVGMATVLGGHGRRAYLVALLDAVMTAKPSQALLTVVKQTAVRLQHRLECRQQKTAGSKVDFMTMVRGD